MSFSLPAEATHETSSRSLCLLLHCIVFWSLHCEIPILEGYPQVLHSHWHIPPELPGPHGPEPLRETPLRAAQRLMLKLLYPSQQLPFQHNLIPFSRFLSDVPTLVLIHIFSGLTHNFPSGTIANTSLKSRQITVTAFLGLENQFPYQRELSG